MTAGSRILIIDGFAAPRNLIGIVLRDAFPASELVEATDAFSLANSLADVEFSIAIAATNLTWTSGTEALREVKRNCPDCSTILFGSEDHDLFSGHILRGAVDAVLHNSSRGYTQVPALIRALTRDFEINSHRQIASTSASLEISSKAPDVQANDDPDVHTAMLVHDLQDPLTVIAQNAQQLATQTDFAVSQIHERQLARISASADRLQAMIDGLKSQAQAAIHKPRFQAVDLNKVMGVVMQHLETQIAQVDAIVLFTDLPEIVCDFDQMVQLFENLIGNSLKFRSEKAPQISIQTVERASEWLLSVSDNGIGVGAADQSRVFDIFQRLHTAEEYPGTGMGLTICRRIARNHGGDIWLQPAPGAGTSIYVSLPKATRETSSTELDSA